MSPQTGSRRYTHTHLKWFMGTLVFSTLHCRDFSCFYFLFSFFPAHEKHKNAKKRISFYFPLSYFLFLFADLHFVFFARVHFCAFCSFCVFGAFCAFWCFLVLFGACKIFLLKKNNKKFKTALITSFILLPNFSITNQL